MIQVKWFKVATLAAVGFLVSMPVHAEEEVDWFFEEHYGAFVCSAPMAEFEGDDSTLRVAGEYSHRGGFAGRPVLVTVGDYLQADFQQPSGGVSVLGSVEVSGNTYFERVRLRYFGPTSTMNKIEVEYLTHRGWINVTRKNVTCVIE